MSAWPETSLITLQNLQAQCGKRISQQDVLVLETGIAFDEEGRAGDVRGTPVPIHYVVIKAGSRGTGSHETPSDES